MADNWNIYRLGKAAAATTAPGQVPQYGLAYDLGTAQWDSSDQFNTAVRDFTRRQTTQQLQEMSAAIRDDIAMADSYSKYGIALTASEQAPIKSLTASPGDRNIASGFLHDEASGIMGAVNTAKGIGRTILTPHDFLPHFSLFGEDDDDEGPTYEKYKKSGGLMGESDFNSYDDDTKQFLIDHHKTVDLTKDIVDTPGIKHMLAGLNAAYRGVQTPFTLAANSSGWNPLRVVPGLDPNWYKSGSWSQAWRESQDQSLGNAIVNSVLQPYAGKDRVTDWKRDSPLYQLTSMATEFGVGFYADPAVIAGKGVGAAARFSRGEIALRENSGIYKATKQALQREQITVRNPVTKALGQTRANQIRSNFVDLREAAKTRTYAEFSDLPMFRKRDIEGQSAASALYYAYRNSPAEGGENMISLVPEENRHYNTLSDLTEQLILGDPKAYAQLNDMKGAVPEELQKFAPGSQTFIDAIDSTKTKIDALQKEADDLERVQTNSPFHEWSLHTELDQRYKDILEADDQLQKYEGYGDWLQNASREPEINRVHAQHFFMDNPYGKPHLIQKVTRPIWLQKANVMPMHDVDLGAESIRRQFQQFEHLMGYKNPEALDKALLDWQTAPTAFDRYQVAADVEENHLIGAAAEHFGADPGVIRAIYDKVISEQNKIYDGILSGQESIYSTAPDVATRLRDGQNISLVDHDPDSGMVTLELMDKGKRVTVTTHESALEPKVRPVDPTQTPNYYQPVDTRRFYLELKRNEEVVQDMSKARAAGAATIDLIDTVGTKFNSLWKPLQLFRFGWPQRVLMDENARALAVLGIPAFTRYYGADYAKVGANVATALPRKGLSYFEKKQINGFNDLVDMSISNPKLAAKVGRDRFPLGPGPKVDDVTRTMDPVDYDAEKRIAPLVPEPWMPTVNPKRLSRINEHVAAWDTYKAAEMKRQAWARAPIPGDEATNIQLKAVARSGLGEHTPSRPYHPLPRIIRDWESDTYGPGTNLGKAKFDGPIVFDPISGKRVKTGHIVPVAHTETNIPDDWDFGEGIGTGLEDWYAKHRELLGSHGHRIVITPEGRMYVGRLFAANRRKDATKYTEFMDTWMHDLGNNVRYDLKDFNDLSPSVEEAYRQFVSTEDIAKVEGETPISTPKRLQQGQVYHGTYNGLPEPDESGNIPLAPKEQVDVASGRMIGKGFYTTTSEDIAEGYGHNLYTIKGAKNGKEYKVFDLDAKPSAAELKRLKKWADEHDTGIQSPWGATDVEILKRAIDEYSSYGFVTTDGDRWVDLMAHLDNMGASVQDLLTRYFEEVHGAGALHHIGGRITGNKSHHVYVWLKPEELLVKPAYEPTGTYTPLIRWLAHPSSKEVPIPENRIIRTGVRNPILQKLHKLHAELETRKAEIRKTGHSWVTDPDLRKMNADEQDMMDALGLEYAHNAPEGEVPNAMGQDWYRVTDPDRFNRMMDEAKAEDAQVELGRSAVGNLRQQEVAAENPDFDADQLDFDLDSVTSRVLRAVLKERETGKGFRKVKSSNGEEFLVPSAYEGHDGDLMRGLVSSQGAIEALSDGHGAALSLFRRNAIGHRAYNPPSADKVLTKGSKEYKQAVEYFHKWSDLLNTQIAHSPIWQKMLNGWSDEKIVNWLDSTPEGAAVVREMRHPDSMNELWVNEHRAKLDYYLPSKKHQRLLGKGRIEPSTLRKEIHPDERPSVFGPDVEFLDKRSGYGRVLSWAMDRMWHALGTAPIDALSRHPFARAMYDLKMKSLFATTDSKWLDQATIDRYEAQARHYARDQVRKHLWDLTDSTNFTDALRFMAPFWGAQQEAITKWIRIVSDRPETVARAFNLQRAVYNNFVTIDEDGQPVERGYLGYHPTDRVVVRIPEFVRHLPFGKELSTLGSIGVPIGSANTVLQGESPLLPGPGPLVTIPADKLLRATSKTYGTQWDDNKVYRWLFPIGRPQHGGIRGVLDQLLPGYGKRVMQAQDQDGVAYANLYTEVAREMDLEAREKNKPSPSPGDVQKRVDFIWGLRTLTGLFAPVQVQYRPKHQFLIDAAHKYQKDYGAEWFDKFMDDYGTTVARYATSSSNSTIDIPPTSQGMEDWSANQALIQKYPDWGGAIISPDAYKDDFNSDAYYAQFQLNLGPGDDTPLRESQSTKERFDTADARAGWYEFRKVDAMLDAQLEQRGLHSIQQTGAEDLAAMKKNFIADLSKRLPAWREEYDNYNNDIYARVGELEKWAFRPEFDSRPDIQGVRQYLMIRDQVAERLDQYAAQTGGSRSLQAEENGALRNWFYDQVGQLAQANPAFAEFYSRYLQSDTLEQGSG